MSINGLEIKPGVVARQTNVVSLSVTVMRLVPVHHIGADAHELNVF
jgi:hypothetical protein